MPSPPRGFSAFFLDTESPLPYLLEDGGVGADLVARLCQFAFLHRGRASHLVQLLAWHPTYLDRFYQTYDLLMYDAGPLPGDWSAYIAIMASSRHFCDYLIDVQSNEFLDLDGNETWLEGIEKSPQKIQSLCKINAILAHQPWRLDSSHIAELCTGPDAWSFSELTHAIIIMTTFHSLSGVVWSCGLLPEVNSDSIVPADLPSRGDEKVTVPEDSTMQLLEALATVEESSPSKSPILSPSFETLDMPQTAEKKKKKKKENQDRHFSFSQFRGNYEIDHEDVIISSSSYSTLHYSDFSWKEQGYPMVNEYFPSCTAPLDDEFRTIYNLTYRT